MFKVLGILYEVSDTCGAGTESNSRERGGAREIRFGGESVV